MCSEFTSFFFKLVILKCDLKLNRTRTNGQTDKFLKQTFSNLRSFLSVCYEFGVKYQESRPAADVADPKYQNSYLHGHSLPYFWILWHFGAVFVTKSNDEPR